MLILGLMWVASWLSGFPSTGSKLLETPKYLTHVLCHSRACQSTLDRTTLQTVLDVQSATRSNRPDADRTLQNNWLGAIEQLLTPDPQPERPSRPLSQFFNTMQSLFGQLPIVADSKSTNPAVAIVEVGSDGTLISREKPLPRLGFWQCPTWQSSPSEQFAMGGFQLWVKGCQVATVPDRGTAESLARQFRQLLETPNLDAAQLQAALVNNQPSATLRDRTIFTVSSGLAARLGRPAELVAIDWINNLRIALGQQSLSLVDAQIQMHQLEATKDNIGGMASWYGPYFHGRQTANGEIFDQDQLTAAHPTLPLGTFLKVTNQLNGKSIVVRVNDRGPYIGDRVLDLSKRAARMINSDDQGVVPIEAVVMQPTLIARAKPPQRVARAIIGY